MSKIYTVYATEKAYYQIRVEAESKEDAIQQINEGNFSSWETIDGDDFKIDEVEEQEDA